MIKESSYKIVGSDNKALDELLQSIRLGDDVVWQVDSLGDYAHFVESFITQSIKDGLKCIYIRFTAHKPVLTARSVLMII